MQDFWFHHFELRARQLQVFLNIHYSSLNRRIIKINCDETPNPISGQPKCQPKPNIERQLLAYYLT